MHSAVSAGAAVSGWVFEQIHPDLAADRLMGRADEHGVGLTNHVVQLLGRKTIAAVQGVGTASVAQCLDDGGRSCAARRIAGNTGVDRGVIDRKVSARWYHSDVVRQPPRRGANIEYAVHRRSGADGFPGSSWCIRRRAVDRSRTRRRVRQARQCSEDDSAEAKKGVGSLFSPPHAFFRL